MLGGMQIHQARPADLKGMPDVSMRADFLVNGRVVSTICDYMRATLWLINLFALATDRTSVSLCFTWILSLTEKGKWKDIIVQICGLPSRSSWPAEFLGNVKHELLVHSKPI
jgi:hypothetical protein